MLDERGDRGDRTRMPSERGGESKRAKRMLQSEGPPPNFWGLHKSMRDAHKNGRCVVAKPSKVGSTRVKMRIDLYVYAQG